MKANGAPYIPRPGSTACRVIGHLESQLYGAEITSGGLSAALGIPGNTIVSSMQEALRTGLIFARQKGGYPRSPMFWSLVDHGGTTNARQTCHEAGEAAQPADTAKETGGTPSNGARRHDPDDCDGGLVGGFAPRLPTVADQPVDIGITLNLHCKTLHQAQRILEFVRSMREVA